MELGEEIKFKIPVNLCHIAADEQEKGILYHNSCKQLCWHLINLIFQYFILEALTWFSFWNGVMVLTHGLSIWIINGGRKGLDRGMKERIIDIWIPNIELAAYPFLFFLLNNSQEPLITLILLPSYIQIILAKSHSLRIQITTLFLTLVLNIYIHTQSILMFIHILFTLYLLYTLLQRVFNNKEKGKLKREKITKIQQEILNEIPNSIIIYHKYKGILHMNKTALNLLKQFKCSSFDDFSDKCLLPATGTTLKENIIQTVDYFNSKEAILNGNNEVTIDFRITRLPTTLTFSSFINKELEIRFCKGRKIEQNGIILIMKENNKETVRREEKVVRRYKNVISKTICHDLKTPLNGIITPLENLSALQSHFSLPLQLMKMSAKFLEYKIEDMIDYSQIELNEFTTTNSNLYIKVLLQNLMNVCQVHASLTCLKLKLEIDRNTPETFIGDSKRLTQIILHLIQNAMKYTKSGTITIYVKRIDQLSIEFGVINPGCGMSSMRQTYLKEFLDKGISSPNVNEGDIGKESTEMGFGLWITQKILEKLGSKLEFESSMINGTRFFFELTSRARSSFSNPKCIPGSRSAGIAKKNSSSPHVDEYNSQYGRKGFSDTVKLTSKHIQEEEKKEKLFTLSENYEQNLHKKTRPTLIIPHNSIKGMVSPRSGALDSPKLDCKPLNLFSPKSCGNLEDDENLDEQEIVEFNLKHSPHTKIYNHTKLVRSNSLGEPIIFTTPVTHCNTARLQYQYRILVVDDMPVNRLVLKLLLEKQKIIVEEASNGEEAIQMCETKLKYSILTKPYDIIFMDIEMPVMNGLEATTALLEMFKEYPWATSLPIIAITAHDTPQIKLKAFEVGMREFSLKPIKNPQLQYYLRKYLDKLF